MNPIFWIVVAQTSNIQPLTCKQKCIVVADRGETCSFSGLPISEQFTDHEPSVCRALVAFGRREMESVDMISFQVSRDWDLRNLDNQKVPTIGPIEGKSGSWWLHPPQSENTLGSWLLAIWDCIWWKTEAANPKKKMVNCTRCVLSILSRKYWALAALHNNTVGLETVHSCQAPKQGTHALSWRKGYLRYRDDYWILGGFSFFCVRYRLCS